MGSKFTNFLRRLMAPTRKEVAHQESENMLDYKGYLIRPTPHRQGSQWLTVGVIIKEFADGVKERRFIRAETHNTKDGADAFAIFKAKQIIDEQGGKLFSEN